ncbi:MAG TPA: aminotransferase class I/II-fold pyridoxal phosphate-dependent enzyme, partial [Chloroflexota bacterium]
MALVTLATRLGTLASSWSIEADHLLVQRSIQRGDVISLAPVTPDLPPPPSVLAALAEAGASPVVHPPSPAMHLSLRAAMAAWYERRFKVSLSPNQHVLPLNGARDGLASIPTLVTNPGDVVLVPDPGYPLYAAAARFTGAVAVPIPLHADSGFLPDMAAIPAAVADRARLLYLNYPNSPTGAIAPASFYHEVVAFAKRHNLVVCQDMSFAGVTYEGYRPLSFLEIPGALDVGVEIHSLSIAFNMPGYGIGVLLGNRQLVEAMGRVQAVLGAPLPEPIQRAAR